MARHEHHVSFHASRYWRVSVTTTDWGRPPEQVPVKPVLVHRSVSAPTSPDTLAIPLHLSAGLSIDMDPENDALPANPLMAPSHSGGDVVHAPSTQLPPCTTSSEIVRGARFDDSNVPVHVPATLAGGAGGGPGGEGEGLEELPPLQARFRSVPRSIQGRAHPEQFGVISILGCHRLRT
jgi:hypothetical protein